MHSTTAQVIDLNEVRPKTLNKTYRGCPVRITYIVATKEWQWSVTFTHTTTITDVAKTQVLALRAAERQIDRTKELRA